MDRASASQRRMATVNEYRTGGESGKAAFEGGQEQRASGPTKAAKKFLPVVKMGEAYKHLGVNDALETTVQQSQILHVIFKTKKDILKRLTS